MPKMQEQFSAGALTASIPKNEGSLLWISQGMPGLSRPSMASEALGLQPGEMQEQFYRQGRRVCRKCRSDFRRVPG